MGQSGKPVFYGGQAVIEGVMMRGPRHAAVAVRRADGHIETIVMTAVPWLTEHKAYNKPILRGAFALWDAMRVGVWGLKWSAAQAMLDATTEDATGSAKPSVPTLDAAQATGAAALSTVDPAQATGATNLAATAAPTAVGPTAGEGTVKGTMGVGLLIGVALFIALPTLLTGYFRHRAGSLGLNVIEGIIRLALFFGYIWAIGKLEGIYRVFQYHGAEHRTINALEAGAPLNPEACRPYSVIHPRCGTSFMVFVLILSTIVYMFFGWHTPLVRLAIRLLLLPIVAGVAYELLRLAGTFRGSALLSIVTWPGRFSQRFTTRQPDDQQTEVAIAALTAVFAAERDEAPDAVPELA